MEDTRDHAKGTAAADPRARERHARWDALGVDELRRRGSLKWTAFPDALGAFVAESDLGTAPCVRTALTDAVEREAFGYLPTRLVPELQEATASWYGRRHGHRVDPGSIQLVPDVLAAFEFAITRLSPAGAPVVVPTPAYMPFLDLPRRLGREIVEVPLLLDDDGWRLDTEGIDAALRGGPGLVVLCNPHNPTGHVASRGELAALEEVVAAHPGTRVFSDEIHGGLALAGSTHVPFASLSPRAARQAITATSTSKAFALPGLKCAQLLLSNDDDLAVWAEHGERAFKLTGTLGVEASIAAYRHGDDWLDDVLSYLDSLRAEFVGAVGAELPGVRLVAPEGTFIAWLDCSGLGLDESPAAFFLREAGVALSDGAACGEGFESWVRLVFATPRPVLERMLRSMGAALRRRGAPRR